MTQLFPWRGQQLPGHLRRTPAMVGVAEVAARLEGVARR